MKKRWLLLLLVGALLMALPILGGLADGEVKSEKVYVLNKNASLWPNKEAKGTPYVKKVGIDYAVRPLEQDGIWTKVELLDGAQGYMHTYYLGGIYKIRLGEHAYAMREKQRDREQYNAVAFDRSQGSDLIVLWEEENWLYVIELNDGIGGYIRKDLKYEIIEYP